MYNLKVSQMLGYAALSPPPPRQAVTDVDAAGTLHASPGSLFQQRCPEGAPPRSSEPGPLLSFMPPGWEIRTTPDGRPFFIDHTSRTTTWVRCSGAAAEGGGSGRDRSGIGAPYWASSGVLAGDSRLPD